MSGDDIESDGHVVNVTGSISGDYKNLGQS